MRDLKMQTQTSIKIETASYIQANEIIKALGFSYAQAINMFNNLVVLNKALPFEIKIPNKETIKAMKEADELDGDFVTLDDFKR